MSAPASPNEQPTSLGRTEPNERDARAGSVGGVVATLRRASHWARSEEARRTARELAADVAEGGWRVVRSIRLPTLQGVLDFLSHQVLANVVGWLAGLASVHLVTRLFEVRGFRNLWGLTASGGRTLVSNDDYRLITTITGFTVGLLMMLFVRHFLLRWISETRGVRAERKGSTRSELERATGSEGRADARFDGLGAD